MHYISPEVQIIVVEVEKGFAQSSRIDGIFEDNAENDFWTIKLITDHYINENNETYNHDVVQGNYFFVNTGICSL